MPAAENSVSGSSYRPADVVRHVGGRTTEVLNTDAEGRMVLADALAYARLELGATVLVDVATLTGAMKVALGTRTAGLFATTDGLADALRTAAVRAGEPSVADAVARGASRSAGQRRRRRQQRARQPGRDDGRALPAAVRR